jgi:small subunit ribosomal protein S8
MVSTFQFNSPVNGNNTTGRPVNSPTNQTSPVGVTNRGSGTGLINDSIGDMLTRIRNACLAKKTTITLPFTRINEQIAQILEKEGFIQSYQTALDPQVSGSGLTLIVRLKYRSKAIYRGKKKESCITNLKRISKPGLRIYANSREIPRILGGTGIVILSTPSGVLTDREARLKGIGGELICSIW